MQLYSNRFQYAINDKQGEFILNFLQEYPIIPLDDNQPMQVSTETLATLVMSISSAQELLNMLQTALANHDK